MRVFVVFLVIYLFYEQNNKLYGVSRSFPQPQRRASTPLVVVATNGRPAERNATVLMENTLKEMRDNASSPAVVEKDSKSTVGGGVEDVYGEDTATEDQFITPWAVSVARSERSIT